MAQSIYYVPSTSNLRSPAPDQYDYYKYVEDGNRTNRQKQGYFYGTECWRDLKITLQNRLSKLTQLSEEISKPIYNNARFIDTRNNIQILVSMVENPRDGIWLTLQA